MPRRSCRFDSCVRRSLLPDFILHSAFCILNFHDGSQDWVIAHNDVVAGSSPASGTTCRSSSVVEHVFPVRFLSVVFSAGRRLWVLVNPAIPVQIRFAARGGGATFSTPGNSTVALFWMGRCASVIELSSSTAKEHLVKTRRCGFDSRPETSKPLLVHPSPFRRVAGLGYR